jgi:hypothetical protein
VSANIDSPGQEKSTAAVSRRFRSSLLWGLLATALGLGIGWLDIHTTEATTTILALLIAGLLLGVLQPTGAWRWAVILALGLPVMAAAGRLLELDTPEPIRLDPLIALVALGFGMAGCYAGVALRWMVRSPPAE